MSERERREQQNEFMLTVQRALRCFVDVHLPGPTSTRHQGVFLVATRPALASPDQSEHLIIQIAFYFELQQRSRNDWTVITRGYDYGLLVPDGKGRSPREIFVYQYHPLLTPDVLFPHLHVHGDVEIAGKPIGRAHFRTGHITLADFFRVLVRDFGLQPRSEHTGLGHPHAHEAILDRLTSAYPEA